MNASNRTAASPLMVVLAFGILYIVWGSTYFFIQKALTGFPALMLGATRFIIAGLLMLGWSMLKKEKVWDVRTIKHAAITGVLLLFVGNGAVIWVEQFMPSAMVAIIISSSPIWFIVLDKPKWEENFRNRSTIAGLVFGFGGVMLLFGEKIAGTLSKVGNPAELGGMALLIIGAMCWAGGSLYSKYRTVNVSAPVNTSWQMLAAGLAFLPFCIMRGEPAGLQWQEIPTGAWLSLVYLVFFGSIAGFSAYVWLLQVRPITQVSTYAYVNPVVAVLLGVIFANEHITLLQIIGLVVILSSVFMINLVKYKNRSAAADQNISNGNNPLLKHEEPMISERLQALR